MNYVAMLVRQHLEPRDAEQLAGAIQQAQSRAVILLTDGRYNGQFGLFLLTDDGVEFIEAQGRVLLGVRDDILLAEPRRRGTLVVTFAGGQTVTFTDIGDGTWTKQVAEVINQYATDGPASARVSTAESHTILATGDRWHRQLSDCTVLGGYGHPLPVGQPLTVTFDASGVAFTSDRGDNLSIALAEVTGLDIGGPGRVTEGGGFIGGGFGLEGIASGMLIAGALNALSTRTEVLTVITLTTRDGEVWFAYTHAEPAALRIELSPMFVAIRRAVQPA